MYTRCPSCRAEISFEPPSNMADLPDGYKHKIKCPNCGVTIGVKIPRQDTIAEIQPTYTPFNPNATSEEPVFQAGSAEYDKKASKKAEKAAKNANKKTGIARNLFLFFFSFIIVGANIFSYLLSKSIISLPVSAEVMAIISNVFAPFNGIAMWEALCVDFASVQAVFELAATAGIWFVFLLLFKFLIFAMPALYVIITFIGMCTKKYCRVFNLFYSTVFATICALALFVGYLVDPATYANNLGNYFMNMIGSYDFGAIIVAALGLIQFLFSLFFLSSMKKKPAKVK